MSKPLVQLTVGMTELIARRPTLCKVLNTNLEDFRELLVQIQRELVCEENLNSVGPTVLAIKAIDETFTLLAAKGGTLK